MEEASALATKVGILAKRMLGVSFLFHDRETCNNLI